MNENKPVNPCFSLETKLSLTVPLRILSDKNEVAEHKTHLD